AHADARADAFEIPPQITSRALRQVACQRSARSRYGTFKSARDLFEDPSKDAAGNGTSVPQRSNTTARFNACSFTGGSFCGGSSKARRTRWLRWLKVIRLVAFDLDGTLVRDRTCVEAIACTIGREQECTAFERLDMRDVPAVAAARDEMARWYRPYRHDELTAGLSDLPLAPGSEEAFALLRERGVATAIVSITWSFAVDWFARRLCADYAHGTRLGPDGIDHVWPADKGRWLRDLTQHLALPRQAVAAIGDSDGDRELLDAAGVRYCVGEQKIAVPGIVHMPRANMLEIARQLMCEPAPGNAR
ncbi:MAG: HAD-IB family phosphatase, partial [Actinomycetota bacterium]|nr:HAD-IB family phosphatase [Actinomycetota bacterium]